MSSIFDLLYRQLHTRDHRSGGGVTAANYNGGTRDHRSNPGGYHSHYNPPPPPAPTGTPYNPPPPAPTAPSAPPSAGAPSTPPGVPVTCDAYGNCYDAYGNLVSPAAGYGSPYGAPPSYGSPYGAPPSYGSPYGAPNYGAPPPGVPVSYDPYGNAYDAYGNLVSAAPGYGSPGYGAPQMDPGVDPSLGFDPNKYVSADDAAAAGAFYGVSGWFDDVGDFFKDHITVSDIKDGAELAGSLLGGATVGALAGQIVSAAAGDDHAKHTVATAKQIAKSDPQAAHAVRVATAAAKQATIATSVANTGSCSYDAAVALIGSHVA